jgi:hypothetical protein
MTRTATAERRAALKALADEHKDALWRAFWIEAEETRQGSALRANAAYLDGRYDSVAEEGAVPVREKFPKSWETKGHLAPAWIAEIQRIPNPRPEPRGTPGAQVFWKDGVRYCGTCSLPNGVCLGHAVTLR